MKWLEIDRLIISGKVTEKGALSSRYDEAFIQREIKRWILSRFTQLPSRIRYELLLRAHPDGHTVECNLELLCDESRWQAQNLGPGLHAAIRATVNSLKIFQC